MAALAARELELPDEQTAKQAGDAVRYLSGLSGSASVQLVIGNDAPEPVKVDLPQKAVRIIVDVLAELAKGNAVTVVPVHPELDSQEAADILNVSLSLYGWTPRRGQDTPSDGPQPPQGSSQGPP